MSSVQIIDTAHNLSRSYHDRFLFEWRAVNRSLTLFDWIFYTWSRYLAGRFPETANAIDLDGRTPLHYAATLADNGHYYNLLLHLGANPLIEDNVSVIILLQSQLLFYE